MESHPSERQVTSELCEIADMIFDGSKTKGDLVKEIKEWEITKAI